MQVMKWSVIALAVAAGTSQLAFASAQSESNGFIEDSSFNILTRMLYMNRDYKNGASNGASTSADPAGYREETGLGLRLLYESGFTQGTVGVGFDAHSLSSVKVDSGRGRYGTGQFAQTDEGRGDDTQSEVGGAVKFRISNTVLKYGNQFVASPVFSTDDSRIMPEVATGTYITSKEIEGLELSAGRFTALSSQTATGRDTVVMGAADSTLKSANIAGASYAFTENFTGAIHASDVDDFFKKQYINLNYNLPLSDAQALNFDLNAYKTKSQGEDLAGDVDNKLWSLAAAYSIGAHKFTLAHQRSSGSSAYAYGIDGNGTIYTSNSVQFSDFDREDERSWQVRYDLNMAEYGVPGLSFMTRYVYGDNIETGVGAEGKEHEFDFETKYVVQDGPAKDLSVRLRSAVWRANSVQNDEYGADNNDFRVIVEYPLSVL